MKITYYESTKETLSGLIKLQLIILEKSPYTSTTYIDADEKGIRVTNISAIELSTDKDNPILFPADITVDFIDTDYEIYNKLVIGKCEDVQLKIIKNNRVEFFGTITKDLDDSYIYDYAEKEVQIEFATPTQKLKEKRFFDIDGNYILENDLGTEDTLKNIFNKILTRCGFEGNVDFKHSWQYQGEYTLTNNVYKTFSTTDLKARLLYVISETHNRFDVKTYDDLLKAIVFSLGGYLSFADYSKPVFRSLLYGNEKLIPDPQKIMYIKRKKIATKDLVRITSKFQILSTEGLDISEWNYNSIENFQGSEDRAFIKDCLFPIEEERDARELFVDLSSAYIINNVKNPFTNQWDSNGKVLLDTWSKIISSWNSGALEIALIGNEYQFYNSIEINGKEFMIESLRKDLVNNETFIEAFPI
ncbi:MAG: hypothetical protein K8F60_16275 [Melioribacteraceae bacterium]|jgi:hypothetical protein|nr:hypothetical protein [Melioribacteraceae bacterium]